MILLLASTLYNILNLYLFDGFKCIKWPTQSLAVGGGVRRVKELPKIGLCFTVSDACSAVR